MIPCLAKNRWILPPDSKFSNSLERQAAEELMKGELYELTPLQVGDSCTFFLPSNEVHFTGLNRLRDGRLGQSEGLLRLGLSLDGNNLKPGLKIIFQ